VAGVVFLFFLFNLHFSLLFLEVTGAGLKFQEKGQEEKRGALKESPHHPDFEILSLFF